MDTFQIGTLVIDHFFPMNLKPNKKCKDLDSAYKICKQLGKKLTVVWQSIIGANVVTYWATIIPSSTIQLGVTELDKEWNENIMVESEGFPVFYTKPTMSEFNSNYDVICAFQDR